jgi:hypothetical protein
MPKRSSKGGSGTGSASASEAAAPVAVAEPVDLDAELPPAPPVPAGATTAPRTKHQPEAVWIHRSQVQNAPYNPRVMRDDARARLRKNVEERGMVTTFTWNRRTGNLVGGHQRLSVLDSIEGTKDYQLQVTVVDYDDKTEREQNLFMNNPLVHGDWDIERLQALFKDDDVSAEHAGFDAADIYKLFGDAPDVQGSEQLDELAEGVRAIADRVGSVALGTKDRDSVHFYAVVVFLDDETRVRFTEKIGADDNRFVDGRLVLKAIGLAENPADEPVGGAGQAQKKAPAGPGADGGDSNATA